MILPKLLQAISPHKKQLLKHPFNQALLNGTLPNKQFVSFIRQDIFYLSHFSKALLMLSHRTLAPERAILFKAISEYIVLYEKKLHVRYLDLAPCSEAYDEITESRIVKDYSDFLLTHASESTIEEAIAALLPCFWLYWYMGTQMSTSLFLKTQHPYKQWLTSYSGKQFSDATHHMVTLAEAYHAESPREAKTSRMINAFATSTKFEIRFWDSIVEIQEAVNSRTQRMSPK